MSMVRSYAAEIGKKVGGVCETAKLKGTQEDPGQLNFNNSSTVSYVEE